jgi:hypothetical protein
MSVPLRIGLYMRYSLIDVYQKGLEFWYKPCFVSSIPSSAVSIGHPVDFFEGGAEKSQDPFVDRFESQDLPTNALR